MDNKMKKKENLFVALLKDDWALLAMFVLFCLYFMALFANFIAPYSKHFADRNYSYAPPSSVYIKNEFGKLTKPYTYNYVRYFDNENLKVIYKQDKSKKYKIKFLTKAEPYKFFGLIRCDRHLFGVEKGGRLFVLGADINGRDNFSRLLFGSRLSLTIGFLALFIAFPIGAFYGAISGYLGGWIDNIMMRFAEATMSIPSFYLLIILAAILPSSMSSIQRFILITVILAFIGWAGIARVIRGMVLSVKNQDFIQASESLGASKFRIILQHILPQTLSYIIVAITLNVPSYILAESGLSFLGLGIQQPDASWGNMLKEAQDYINVITRPWLLTPGILIFIAVLSFNLIGDTIRDVLDPKSLKR